ncbi:TPA: hypothetical protein HA265_00250 [Candidatus Woesearchaeota archaeon]|nr:hypothetical protein [Candidatus Woesearchaeota archaeon]
MGENMIKYALYFLISGAVITAAAIMADRGKALIGGILMVLPNMSLVAFYFINNTSGATATIQVIKTALLGTIFVWPFYMFALLMLIPKIGVNRSLMASFALCVVLGAAFVVICKNPLVYNWIRTY